MIISWLTAADNTGGVLLSVNKRRHSAAALTAPGSAFTLSVACAGMEELVLAVGACSGRDVDKFTSVPGLARDDVAGALVPPGIKGAVAFMECEVRSAVEGADGRHWTIGAQVRRACVMRSMWNGKHLGPRQGEDKRYVLTFLGAQRFGHVMPVQPR